MTVNALERRLVLDPVTSALGWGLVIGSVAMVFLGLVMAADEEPTSPIHLQMTGVNVVQHVLLIGGVFAAARLGGARYSLLARAGFGVALISLLLLIVAEVTTLVDMAVATPLFGVATVGMAVGLTIAGAGAIRARIWVGWASFALLATGTYIPLVLIPAMMIPGLWFHYAIGIWGLCFLWLAMAILRAEAE